MRSSLVQSYPGARLVMETGLASVARVSVVGRGAPLHTLLAQVATKYVLLAGDLDTVTTWANIERGVSRLKLQTNHRRSFHNHLLRDCENDGSFAALVQSVQQ